MLAAALILPVVVHKPDFGVIQPYRVFKGSRLLVPEQGRAVSIESTRVQALHGVLDFLRLDSEFLMEDPQKVWLVGFVPCLIT